MWEGWKAGLKAFHAPAFPWLAFGQIGVSVSDLQVVEEIFEARRSESSFHRNAPRFGHDGNGLF